MNIHSIRSADPVHARGFADLISVVVGDPGNDLWIVMSIEKAAALRDAITTAIAQAMVDDATA